METVASVIKKYIHTFIAVLYLTTSPLAISSEEIISQQIYSTEVSKS